MYIWIINANRIYTKLKMGYDDIEDIIFFKSYSEKDSIHIIYRYKDGKNEDCHVKGKMKDSRIIIKNIQEFYKKIRSRIINLLFITQDEKPVKHDWNYIIYLENLI